jgi:hypothetical protein
MKNVTKLLLVVLTAALVASLGSTTATALRSLSLEGVTTQTLNQRALTLSSELGSIICDTTLVKTVSRVIPKMSGVLIGRITDVRTANCIGSGGVRANGVVSVTPVGLEAPERWRLVYVSILGTLPRITGIRIKIEQSLILILFRDVFTVSHLCHVLTNVIGLAAVAADGTIGLLRSESTEFLRAIDLNGNGCPATGSYNANALTPLQTVTVKLI